MRESVLLFKRVPYGESSLVVQGLAQHSGRVHVLAKGAYRLNSRYAGALDLFDTLELDWSQRAGAGLGELREARILVRARGPRRCLRRYRAALSVLELLELGAREGVEQRGLFELCSETLLELERDACVPELLQLSFALRFLAELGLRPALTRCASCAGPAEAVSAAGTPMARVAFSAEAGGRLCRRCALSARAQGGRVGTLAERVLAHAQNLLEGPPSGWDALPSSGPKWRELCDFCARFLEYHLERRPRLGPHSLLARGAPRTPISA